ncbi:MAG: protease modulator HflC [Planctomycetota bacterium]
MKDDAKAEQAAGEGAAAARPGNRLALVVAALVVGLLLLRMTVYTVQSTEVAVLLTFGRPTSEDSAQGAHFKWPWPIQQVKRFDKRLRVLNGPLEELSTADKRAVLVSSFVLWRVASGKTFLEKVDEREVDHKLVRILRSHQAAAIGQVRFGQLVSPDRAQLAYEQVEEQVRQGVQTEVAQLGIEVVMTGIRRLGLPQRVTEAVFQRMKEDRNTLAAQILERGRREAKTIRNKAETERRDRLREARVKARGYMADAERAAQDSYAKMAEEPELATFLKKLEALRNLLRDKSTTLVFDTDLPPFDVLKAETAPVSSEGRK